jgi:tRNA (cmo5U34)-methyltransferase
VALSQLSPGAHWQRADAAGWFLDQRQARLPLIDLQEDLIRCLFERHGREVRRFIDLGCGDGALSELLLGVFPAAEAVLVDFSEPMLARVGERLGERGGSWRIVRGDLSAPGWRDGLPSGRYGAAVSSLAIHHLPAERKRSLYREIFQLLEAGAMFVNLDYVSVAGPLHGLWEETLLENSLRLERARGGGRSAEELERDLCDDADEDRPDPLEDQLEWLREAGFAQVEVHFKWAEDAIFGGIKPS